ncbi:MAG TPA: glycosyltransferase [Stellaceae bacterium]|nr:glycosyltransferase [Stellaceae bacterium]
MKAQVIIDGLRLGATLTGIERFTLTIISYLRGRSDLALTVYGGDRLVLLHHLLLLPLTVLFNRRARVVLSLFPPSPLFFLCARRTLFLAHDMFYLDRKDLLNWRARFYLSPCMLLGTKFLRHYLVNSEYTKQRLLAYVDKDKVTIDYLRPIIENIFKLTYVERHIRPAGPIKLIAIGTVEPRKNYAYAIDIVDRLRTVHQLDVELEIFGRRGWKVDELTDGKPFVSVREGVDDAVLSAAIDSAHFIVSTSLAEGLGLPMLEVQHGGLPAIASPIDAYRETLKGGAIFVPFDDVPAAAAAIAQVIGSAEAYGSLCQAAAANLRVWNETAGPDWERLAQRLKSSDFEQRTRILVKRPAAE